MNKPSVLLRPLRVLALLGLAASGPAFAEFTELVTFDPGVACTFGLKVESDGTGVRVNRDPASGRWRSIEAGTGPDLRLTNVSSGASIRLQGNGAVIHTERAEANGVVVTQVTGHVVLIMFPTDTPPGPSTTLYTGKVRYSIDATGNTTILSQSGKTLDICAAVAD